jgi:hypothetical protein
MVSTGGEKALGILENIRMVGNDILKVRVYQGCINYLNGMELEMMQEWIFLSKFSMQWELMIFGDPVVMPWNLYLCPSC